MMQETLFWMKMETNKLYFTMAFWIEIVCLLKSKQTTYLKVKDILWSTDINCFQSKKILLFIRLGLALDPAWRIKPINTFKVVLGFIFMKLLKQQVLMI